jgi:hypothetical protein
VQARASHRLPANALRKAAASPMYGLPCPGQSVAGSSEASAPMRSPSPHRRNGSKPFAIHVNLIFAPYARVRIGTVALTGRER